MKLLRTGWLVLPVLVLVSGCGTTPQQTSEPPAMIARDDLFGNPEKTAVRLSPDGTRLSWLAPVDGVLNVWVAPVNDPSAARPVTRDERRGIRRYLWAFTNEHLIYLQDTGGDENWRAYVVDLQGDTVRDLTPIDGVQVQIQGVSHRHPGQVVLAINDRDPRLHDLYLIDLASGARTLLEQNPGYVGWLTDDELDVRLGMQPTADGGMKVLRKAKTGEWADLFEVGSSDALTTQPLGFDESGENLYLLDSRDRNTAGLFRMELPGGETELVWENPKADVDNVMAHPTKNTVQAASATFARREWEILDDAIRGDVDYLRTVADGELEVVDRSLDDKRWIVGFEMADAPYRYYLYDRDAGKASLLFTSRPELENVRLAAMHDLVLKARDGRDLVSYLTLPVESDADGDGKPAEPLPMVLFVHGGPWARDQWGYNTSHQWLANRGYAVLSVNYRGSTGLGKDFVNAANFEWAGAMHDDLIDAVNWAVQEKIADPARVAIMGGSYGGYATLVGMTFTPETFACGVDIVGPSNLVTLLQSIPPYWEPMIELFATRVGDHRTEGGRQLLIERSPLTRADQIQKPLLIGQGANDPRVNQQESDQIVQAMQANEIPVTYVLFPDEGHGFARPENRLAFFAVAESFLGECLGGRVENFGDDLAGSTIQVPTGAEQIAGLPEILEQVSGEGSTAAGAGP